MNKFAIFPAGPIVFNAQKTVQSVDTLFLFKALKDQGDLYV